MSNVRIWPTLSGALILTEDTISFGFYPPEDIPQLQRDLEEGLSVNQAAGFSGSVYSFDKIRRIYPKEANNMILVEYRDFFGKDKEDFTFRTRAGFQDFCQTVPEFLGPAWKRGPVPNGSIWGILIPMALGALCALLTVSLLLAVFNDPGPRPGEVNKRNLPVTLGILAAFALAAVGCTYWLIRRIKNPPRIECYHRP